MYENTPTFKEKTTFLQFCSDRYDVIFNLHSGESTTYQYDDKGFEVWLSWKDFHDTFYTTVLHEVGHKIDLVDHKTVHTSEVFLWDATFSKELNAWWIAKILCKGFCTEEEFIKDCMSSMETYSHRVNKELDWKNVVAHFLGIDLKENKFCQGYY